MEDVYEPLEHYDSVLKLAHAQNTSEFFESLLAQSGVDEARNTEIVGQIRSIEDLLTAAGKTSGLWKALRIGLYVAALVCAYLAYDQHPAWSIGTVAALGWIFLRINAKIRSIDAHRAQLKTERDALEATAWQQMAPLNNLYDWADFAQIAQKSLPRIEIDSYFSADRLDNLRKAFGWNDDFNQTRAIAFAHSGLINGNPFVLGQTMRHWIGTKTYHGTLSISWTESVRGSDGKWKTVVRHQTLKASVTKPFPEYADEAVLLYGNYAAPDLSFSRMPSSLSGLDDGLINDWRKSHAIKKLEAKSRKLDGQGGFTVMANREFDSLFGATDRDNEVQFRLLFTPLAQQEMVKLLKDKTVGYGDRFAFIKGCKINVIQPHFMFGKDISASPALFRAYDLGQARKFFNAYHNDLFKSVYFGFAPLLAIPLYQQHRPQSEMYKDVLKGDSCFWEHEAAAYYLGEGKFRHPQSITRNMLKTRAFKESDGAQVVHVTAHGFQGIERTDYISVSGGDGHRHKVPVHWVEYLPVQQTSEMLVHDGRNEPAADHQAKWRAAFDARGIPSAQSAVRRSMAVAIMP